MLRSKSGYKDTAFFLGEDEDEIIGLLLLR